LVKLQRADICWPQDRLPQIRLDKSEGDARAEFAGDIERLTEAMRREAVGREQPSVK